MAFACAIKGKESLVDSFWSLDLWQEYGLEHLIQLWGSLRAPLYLYRLVLVALSAAFFSSFFRVSVFNLKR